MLHGQTRYNMPSSFLDEVPQELLKWLTPRPGYSGNGGNGVSPAPTGGFGGRAKSGMNMGGFRIGESVTHPKFGLGVIVNAEGGQNDVRVQVNFGSSGMKWLALNMAKLEAV